MTPADYARSYAHLFTWFWDGSDWGARKAPIVDYLQNDGGPKAKAAIAAEQAFRAKLPGGTGIRNVNGVATFNFNEYDYINSSITRCFIGKACPWEIQETLQLASEIGFVSDGGLAQFCKTKMGVDCGGFVANYWGEGCPHMVDTKPAGYMGILPRSFGDNSYWSDGKSRRRPNPSKIQQGDAAIFFSGVVGNKPDNRATANPPGSRNFVKGTGSQAHHIGLVSDIGYSGDSITSLKIADSRGSKLPSMYGGSGVNVSRATTLGDTGVSDGWCYVKVGDQSVDWPERIYFVGPPAGAGAEEAYNIGDTYQ